jgi:hypothetical protein
MCFHLFLLFLELHKGAKTMKNIREVTIGSVGIEPQTIRMQSKHCITDQQ